ncbi:MAG TPA: lactate racemase domain-containing protein, partial [Candidatus Cryptobacteroides sp.]|nr:lactate racemase domain-containing protein [Candidatus Cryptobacteroides sp.]
MLYYAKGSVTDVLSDQEVKEALFGVFDKLGKKKRVLAIPPDFTRLNSFAGPITGMVEEYYKERLTDVLPALGTHTPMTAGQIAEMFPDVPAEKFRVHDWRNEVETIGEIPASYVEQVSEGKLDYSMKVQLNRLLLNPEFDAIFSIGQVVPHEVVGMANHTKNIFVGTGGSDFINKSHFIGACYGMERIMGRAHSPVRDVFEYAGKHFAAQLPIIYILTVRGKENEKMVTKGLFVGDDFECFQKAAELSLQTNFIMVEKPIKKCLVWLDPA